MVFFSNMLLISHTLCCMNIEQRRSDDNVLLMELNYSDLFLYGKGIRAAGIPRGRLARDPY